MPLDAKPLFRPDVLRAHLGAFTTLPDRIEAVAPKLTHWAELLSTRRARRRIASWRRLVALRVDRDERTPDEVSLMWSTVPPRMPVTPE